MEAIFKAMDLNNDGMLSMDEIKQGYDKHFGTPIDDDEIKRMFKEIDTDGNGTIDYSEFLMATDLLRRLRLGVKRLMLGGATRQVDHDDSGIITGSISNVDRLSP